MKNITFSADEDVIAKARAAAASKSRTLNDEFREWLAEYPKTASAKRDVEEFQELIQRLRYIRLHGPYTRDEMNERR
jgi:hypothetical protein